MINGPQVERKVRVLRASFRFLLALEIHYFKSSPLKHFKVLLIMTQNSSLILFLDRGHPPQLKSQFFSLFTPNKIVSSIAFFQNTENIFLTKYISFTKFSNTKYGWTFFNSFLAPPPEFTPQERWLQCSKSDMLTKPILRMGMWIPREQWSWLDNFLCLSFTLCQALYQWYVNLHILVL